MIMTQTGRLAVLVCGLFVATPPAWAHHGPTKAIEDLSDRIAVEGPSPELFARRGDEFRALGELIHAAEDYESALAIDPGWTPALYGLAHVLVDRGRLQEAEAVAKRGIESAQDLDGAAPFHALLAQIHEQSDCCDDAIQSWNRALASSRPEVDWFLSKAQLLWKMHQVDAAEETLRSAMRRNPSAALKRAWYESLIRCGRLSEAEDQVEAGLKRAKWKSTWLLLRARLHAAQDRPAEARRDALAALAEIDQRLRPDSPNPFLAADKAQALALLGRRDQAKEQAEIARALNVPAWKLAGFEDLQTRRD